MSEKKKMSSSKKAKKIAFAAIIAAIYAALTLALSFMVYGPLQFRIAEGLTVLPYFSPFAIYGLFVGCVISNVLSPIGIPDMVFGSLATLIAAVLTYLIGRSNLKYKKFLAPLPPVVVNAVVVGILIKVLYVKDVPLYMHMLYVGFGQLVCCYGIGIPIITMIEKNETLKRYLDKLK